jgi:hypothetical protein
MRKKYAFEWFDTKGNRLEIFRPENVLWNEVNIKEKFDDPLEAFTERLLQYDFRRKEGLFEKIGPLERVIYRAGHLFNFFGETEAYDQLIYNGKGHVVRTVDYLATRFRQSSEDWELSYQHDKRFVAYRGNILVGGQYSEPTELQQDLKVIDNILSQHVQAWLVRDDYTTMLSVLAGIGVGAAASLYYIATCNPRSPEVPMLLMFTPIFGLPMLKNAIKVINTKLLCRELSQNSETYMFGLTRN